MLPSKRGDVSLLPWGELETAGNDGWYGRRCSILQKKAAQDLPQNGRAGVRGRSLAGARPRCDSGTQSPNLDVNQLEKNSAKHSGVLS